MVTTKVKKSPKKSSKSPEKKPSPKKKEAVVKEKPIKRKIKIEIVYPHINVVVFADPPEGHPNPGAFQGRLTMERAKEILGWTEETEEAKFGSQYMLTDINGRRVRCLNNLTNRPFYTQLAKDWQYEILNGKWQLNGESLVLDRTGMVQDGQHRLVGLVLAGQEWERNSKAYRAWKQGPPAIEIGMWTGISEKDDVINTIGCGKPRSLTDVVYRSELFAKLPDRDRLNASRSLAHAIKFLWRRLQKDKDAFCPRRSHSESLDFLHEHGRLLECVKHVSTAEGGGAQLLSRYINLGYASGLLYLMAACATDYEDYLSHKGEKGIDWKLWDKACNFWEELAGGSKKLKPLADRLLQMEGEGGAGLAEKSATVIKAWNLYSDREPITPAGIEVLVTTDELGRVVLAEYPQCGGIDVGPQEKEEGEEDSE